MTKTIDTLDKSRLRKLLEIYALNWLAHDGCWFQSIEQEQGMQQAKKFNDQAWERFTVIEARRIMKFLDLSPGGGLDALAQALEFRLYACINTQSIKKTDEHRLVFEMNDCRVQSTRKRKGLADYPCKSAGIVEYSGFAKTIDPRINTRCIGCPPDEHPDEWFCCWEFTLPRHQ